MTNARESHASQSRGPGLSKTPFQAGKTALDHANNANNFSYKKTSFRYNLVRTHADLTKGRFLP